MSGDVFEKLFVNYLVQKKSYQNLILSKAKIFARTNPTQKASIVKCFKHFLKIFPD